jgi:cholesterol transport system auxiliary component
VKRCAAGLAVLITGCLSQPHTPESALYDLGFGPQPSAEQAAQRAGVAQVQVTAPSWLNQTAMHYRLLYEDPLRTRSYAYARWLAPPTELVAQRLRQALTARTVAVPAGGLEVQLEEYVQVFETPERSVGRIMANVRSAGAAQTRFAEQIPAQTADAAGGARALATATDNLISRIIEWLGTHGEGEATARPYRFTAARSR